MKVSIESIATISLTQYTHTHGMCLCETSFSLLIVLVCVVFLRSTFGEFS